MPLFNTPVINTSVVPILLFSSDSTAPTYNATLLVDATSGALIITLPPALTAPSTSLSIKKIDSTQNTVTIKADGSELIWNVTGSNTLVITSQGTAFSIQSNTVSWYLF